MWNLIANLSTLLMGAAAAASLGESLARGQTRRQQRRQLKRGMILPKEAAHELEERIGGRVVVGQDLEGFMLIVLRHRVGATVPPEFAGYRVRFRPRLAEPPRPVGSSALIPEPRTGYLPFVDEDEQEAFDDEPAWMHPGLQDAPGAPVGMIIDNVCNHPKLLRMRYKRTRLRRGSPRLSQQLLPVSSGYPGDGW